LYIKSAFLRIATAEHSLALLFLNLTKTIGMKKLSVFSLALLLIAAIPGCQKSLNEPQKNRIENGSSLIPMQVATECGTPVVKSLLDHGGVITFGSVTISNDENNTYVTITSTLADYAITRIAAAYGDLDHVTTALTVPDFFYSACEGPNTTEYLATFAYADGVTSHTVTIPNSAYPAEGCIWISLLVTAQKPGGLTLCGFVPEGAVTIGSAQYQSAFTYCLQDCPPPPPDDCGPGRTQTPGGWGAKPEGNNPGTYLHANFEAVFGELTVGCGTGNSITLTTAQAITDLLPTGGKPAALTQDYTDPASIKNVLVGHLVAITLAVGFDAADEEFGSGDLDLGDMVIGSGLFAGKTVSEFLAIANDVLGGCSTAYTASQIQETAESINENYVDGTKDNGFLICPEN
jgi:hypothetical protein